MKIKDILNKDAMIMDLKATTKEAAIDEMIAKDVEAGVLSDAAKYKTAILAREAQSTTGIGDGIAMPHAKNDAVQKTTVLFAKSDAGVDYDALDGQPVHLFFMIAAPEGANNEHLQALATLSGLLIDPELVAKLKSATTPDEIIDLFSNAESAKEERDAAQDAKEQAAAAKAQETTTGEKPYIVAVTACITGIAHTYMAEEALKKAGEKLGIDIKVETNGSEGVKHLLTSDDINRAQGVIITADKKVAMDRFDGKQLIHRPVIDGIKKPEELINDILANEGQTFHAANNDAKSEETAGDNESAGRKVYTSLMNGVSNMLPFVVGGGILMAASFALENFVGAHSLWFTFFNQVGNWAFSFLLPVLAAYIAEAIGDRPALMPGFVGGYMASLATASIVKSDSPAGFLGALVAGFLAGYVTLFWKKIFKNLPKSLEGLKPIFILPILGLATVGALMFFAVNPVFGFLNGVITSFLENMGTANAVLLGGVLGGMMAIDMGGPFNKAAYVFAIGAFTATQNGDLMAAVMIGGMIPPLAIAIATSVWPKKWTKEERTAGISNYVLGISFITEGAIPFAAKDPIRIITSSVIGSAIGGALSQLMHVSVPAPHGGIFAALFLSNNLIGFLVSLVVGAIISAVILGFWKKNVAVEN